MGQIDIVQSNYYLFSQAETFQIQESFGQGSGTFANYLTFTLPGDSKVRGLKVFRNIEWQDKAGFAEDEQRARDEFLILAKMETANGHAPKAFALAHYVDGLSKQWAIVEEHITGLTFEQVKDQLLAGFPSAAYAALEVGRSLCEALDCCRGFELGEAFSHRDPSFSNMRFKFNPLSNKLNCVLLDFGQGTKVNGTPTPNWITHLASLRFGAPEMFGLTGTDKKNSSLDTWGAAALMYYVRTGQHPFADQLDALGVGNQITTADCEKIMSIKQQDPDFSAFNLSNPADAALAAIIRKGLTAQPAERPTPGQLLKLIEGIVAELPNISNGRGTASSVAAVAPAPFSGATPEQQPQSAAILQTTPELPIQQEATLEPAPSNSSAFDMPPYRLNLFFFEGGQLIINPGAEELKSFGRQPFKYAQADAALFKFWMTCDWADQVTSIRFGRTSRVQGDDLSFFFSGLSNLKSVDLRGLDTSRATDMSRMFIGCNLLERVDLSSLDCSQITNTTDCFYHCENLEEIIFPASGFPNLTKTNGMFFGCVSLEDLDLTCFDTSKVTDMSFMFAFCENLNTLDLSSFDTRNVTNMEDMFSFCWSLETIYASPLFVCRQGTDVCMFDGCNILEGGQGSSCPGSSHTNEDDVSGLMARLDSYGDKPGYFTIKPGLEQESMELISYLTVDGKKYALLHASFEDDDDMKTIHIYQVDFSSGQAKYVGVDDADWPKVHAAVMELAKPK